MTYLVQIDNEVREATAKETKAIDEQRAETEAKKQADVNRQALKEATLAKLGLTADEVAALLS